MTWSEAQRLSFTSIELCYQQAVEWSEETAEWSEKAAQKRRR